MNFVETRSPRPEKSNNLLTLMTFTPVQLDDLWTYRESRYVSS